MVALSFSSDFAVLVCIASVRTNSSEKPHRPVSLCSVWFTKLRRTLTCSHTSHVDQPPLRDAGQNDRHSVASRKAARLAEHVGGLSGQGAQLSEAPLHLAPFAVHPPQGGAGRPLSCLATAHEREETA